VPGNATERVRLVAEAGFARTRRPVDIVPILPEEVPMFFTSYRPEWSRRLIELGRRDAAAVLEGLRS
jgi:hypothetical protein